MNDAPHQTLAQTAPGSQALQRTRVTEAMSIQTDANPMKAAESGMLRFDGSSIIYGSKQSDAFTIPLSRIAVIGEFTTDNGPFIDDWFLVFVPRHAHEWLEVSQYADGTGEVLQQLSIALGCSLHFGLANSTQFASRIIWPPVLADRPLFTFHHCLTASGFLRRLHLFLRSGVSHRLSPDALSATERSA